MKAVVAAFNQEKALVGAFSVIVQPVVEPIEHCTALIRIRPSLTFTPRHAHIMLDNLDQVLSKMYNLGN